MTGSIKLVLHYKQNSGAVICRIGPWGRCPGTCLQTDPKTPMRLMKQKAVFGKQNGSMASKVRLTEYVLDVSDDSLGSVRSS